MISHRYERISNFCFIHNAKIEPLNIVPMSVLRMCVIGKVNKKDELVSIEMWQPVLSIFSIYLLSLKYSVMSELAG